MLQSTMSSIESSYRQIYEANFPRMRFIKELGIPIPEAFHAAAELIINLDLRRAVSEDWPDIASITELVEAADSWNVRLDNAGIGFAFGKNLERLTDDLEHNPGDIEALSGLAGLVSLAVTMPFTVNTWQVQNRYWDMLNSVYPAFKERAGKGEAAAATWLTTFARLGELLHVRMR